MTIWNDGRGPVTFAISEDGYEAVQIAAKEALDRVQKVSASANRPFDFEVWNRIFPKSVMTIDYVAAALQAQFMDRKQVVFQATLVCDILRNISYITKEELAEVDAALDVLVKKLMFANYQEESRVVVRASKEALKETTGDAPVH